MSALSFILGGSRSGKSARAESLATEMAVAEAVIYVATCRASGLDAEMQARIDKHQRSRPEHWLTVEDQFDLDVLAEKYANRVILIDCLTLWLSHCSETDDDAAITLKRLEQGLFAFKNNNARLIIVSNDLGSGLIPIDSASRAYRDLVGSANQLVAKQADLVELVVAGIPLSIKTPNNNALHPG